MSELRFDPTTNDWVVFAPSRALRPHGVGATQRATTAAPAKACPFCPGNEALTPPEIDADREAGRWLVRVVPNKFPALRIEEDVRRLGDGEMFRYMQGCGAHEVVIESPDHCLGLAQQPVVQVERVLSVAQRRGRDLMRDPRFQSIIIFKNHGESAGTSLSHPHWQIIATPIVPRSLRQKHFEAAEFFDREGSCLYSVLVDKELEAGRRVLDKNEDFVALMPYASHLPFETWILPRRRQATFLAIDRLQLHSLAELLRTVLVRLHTGLEDPHFNLTIDSATRGEETQESFLWHLRIVPRLSIPAGFELGSGMSINTVMPEAACEFLREVPVSPVENSHSISDTNGVCDEKRVPT